MATNSRQIFDNTDGNFTEALTSLVKNFEDVDASQASGKINVIGTDGEGSVSIDMNTVGGSGDDSLTTGSGADIIKGGAGNDIIIIQVETIVFSVVIALMLLEVAKELIF